MKQVVQDYITKILVKIIDEKCPGYNQNTKDKVIEASLRAPSVSVLNQAIEEAVEELTVLKERDRWRDVELPEPFTRVEMKQKNVKNSLIRTGVWNGKKTWYSSENNRITGSILWRPLRP